MTTEEAKALKDGQTIYYGSPSSINDFGTIYKGYFDEQGSREFNRSFGIVVRTADCPRLGISKDVAFTSFKECQDKCVAYLEECIARCKSQKEDEVSNCVF